MNLRSPIFYAGMSIVTSLFTIVVKFSAYFLTGSVGLLSDALESFVNLAAAMFGLLMVTVAERPADEGHPFGHHGTVVRSIWLAAHSRPPRPASGRAPINSSSAPSPRPRRS